MYHKRVLFNREAHRYDIDGKMKLTDGGGGTYVGPKKMANEIVYNQTYTIPDFH